MKHKGIAALFLFSIITQFLAACGGGSPGSSGGDTSEFSETQERQFSRTLDSYYAREPEPGSLLHGLLQFRFDSIPFKECFVDEGSNLFSRLPFGETNIKGFIQDELNYFYCSRIHGNFGDDGRGKIASITGLRKLPNIYSLFISGNPLTDITGIEYLKKLQTLEANDIPANNFSKLKNLTALKEISLQYTKVSDLSWVKGLTHLESLDLRGTLVSQLAPLDQLASLRVLTIAETEITSLADLSDFPALEYLAIGDLDVNYDDIVIPRSVEHLEVANSSLHNVEFLQNATHLKKLYLNNNDLEDISLLQSLVNLEMLGLKGNDSIDCASIDLVEETIEQYKENSFGLQIERPSHCDN